MKYFVLDSKKDVTDFNPFKGEYLKSNDLLNFEDVILFKSDDNCKMLNFGKYSILLDSYNRPYVYGSVLEEKP